MTIALAVVEVNGAYIGSPKPRFRILKQCAQVSLAIRLFIFAANE